MRIVSAGAAAVFVLALTAAADAAITLNVPVSLVAVPAKGPGGGPLSIALTCTARAGGVVMATLKKPLPLTNQAFHDTVEMSIPNTAFAGNMTDNYADQYSCFVTATENGADVTAQVLKGNALVKGHL